MEAQRPARPPKAGFTKDWGEGDERLLNWGMVRNLLGWVAGSPRRHPVLLGVLFFTVVAFTLSAAYFMPNRYRSFSKLLAHRDETMASLGNPHRSLSWAREGPTFAAYETMMARANLINIIEQTKLIEKFKATRNPLLRAKDWVIQTMAGTWTDEREMEAMVGLLNKWLTVETNGANHTFTITAVWPEPKMARQLVDTLQRSFLESRHVAEVQEISETISILEAHQAEADERIEAGVREVERVVNLVRTTKGGVPVPAKHRDPAKATATVDTAKAQDAALARSLIESKRQALADLEEFRRRRVAELTTQLAEQKTIFAAGHPVIIDLEERRALVERESLAAVNLRRELEQLELAAGAAEAAVVVAPSPRVAEAREALAVLDPLLCGDPTILVAQDQLLLAVGHSEELQMREDAARLELDITRAAFKYRYSVVSPAMVPRDPESPNIPLVILSGLLMAVFISIAGVCGYDLARGRVLETWQVETVLKLEVLGHLKS